MSGSRVSCCKCGSGPGAEPLNACCVLYYPSLSLPRWLGRHHFELDKMGQPPEGQGISWSATLNITRTRTYTSGGVSSTHTQTLVGSASSTGAIGIVSGQSSEQGISPGCQRFVEHFTSADGVASTFERTDTFVDTSGGTLVYEWDGVEVNGSTGYQCYPGVFLYTDGSPAPEPSVWGHFNALVSWKVDDDPSNPGGPQAFETHAINFGIVSNPATGEFFARVTAPGVGPRGFAARDRCVTIAASDFASGSVEVSMAEEHTDPFPPSGGVEITYECTGTVTFSWAVLIPPVGCPDQTLPTYTPTACTTNPVPPGGGPTGPSPPGCCPNATGLFWAVGSNTATLMCYAQVTVRRIRKTTDLLDREWVLRIPATTVNKTASCKELRTTVLGQRLASGGAAPATIPATEAYAYSPTGFSGGVWGSPAPTTQVINCFAMCTLDLGDDASLPAGARTILAIHDGIAATAPKAFEVLVQPGPGPGSVADITISSGGRVPTAVLDDLRPTGQDFYHTGDNDGFFYSSLVGLRTGEIDTTSGSLYRFEIDVDWLVIAGGFGPCPPPEENPDALLALATNPEAEAAIERHMAPAQKCRGCEGPSATA